MNPIDIVNLYYQRSTKLYTILELHGTMVAHKALEIAKMHPELKVDLTFLREAALLHDIGIFKTDAPEIDCFRPFSYICHGYLGSEIVQKEGYPHHALVCERHTGVGISLQEIQKRNLPLPHRDMIPVSMEEIIICFADKFYSKAKLGKEKSIDQIRKGLSKYGNETLEKFDTWCEFFLG